MAHLPYETQFGKHWKETRPAPLRWPFCYAGSSAARHGWPSISAVTPRPNPLTYGRTTWRPTMNLPITATTIPTNSLPAQLQQIGLRSLPANLDDFLTRATKARWSARQILEQLVQSESAERSHRSLERRLRLSGIKKFKPMADFDWTWPTKVERDVIERALTLDFLQEGRNLVLVGA